MKRILICGLMLLIVSPTLAAVRWGVYFNGCEGKQYVFEIANFDLDQLTGRWWSFDGRSGAIHLDAGESKYVTLPYYFIDVDTNHGRIRLSVGTLDCNPDAPRHSTSESQGPVQAYLLAAPGIAGPATWVCEGSRMNYADGSPIVTPTETFLWHGEPLPVTVLPLSSYRDPKDCSVEGAPPTWYVDFERWACLSVQGVDDGCAGSTDFH